MKIVRIVFAALFTILLLYIASTNSRGRPELYTHDENGFSFEYSSVPKGIADSIVRIALKIEGPLDSTLIPVMRRYDGRLSDANLRRGFKSIPLTRDSSDQSLFYTVVQAGPAGGKFYYFFEIRDRTGGLRASLYEDRENTEPFLFKYIGVVPSFVLIGHIVLIFATVFFVVLATIHSIDLLRGAASDLKPMARNFLLATICAFLGCYPFGFGMNWYAFATVWEGVPFGTDATDNKTQLLFVYLLFMMVLTVGALTSRKRYFPYSTRATAWYGVGAFVFMLFIYLIPHSIQFSPGLTYTVCYSIIGLIALLYVVGLFVHRRS